MLSKRCRRACSPTATTGSRTSCPATRVFPNLRAIVLSRRAWSRLSDRQRAAISAAARGTLAAAKSALARDERAELAELCGLHVHVAVPTAAQLAQLVQTATSATDVLARDPAAVPMLAALRDLPGAGPQPSALPLPPECAASAGSPGNQHAATIPNGVYVTTTSVADFRAEGVTGPDWNKPITWTTNLRDGHFRTTQVPDYPDQGPLTGTYKIHGDEVRFTYDGSVGEAPETFKWSYFDRLLRFTVVLVADAGARAQYGAHPWRRVR